MMATGIARRLALVVSTLAVLVTPLAAQTRNLHDAVVAGNRAAVEAGISSGAPIDARDAQRRTPLLLAVAHHRVEIAQLLIDAGADINAQAANADTPWLLAGAEGQTEILQLMLPHGPDFTIRNRFGGNALIPACERGHIATVTMLVATKIDVNHVNNLGWTCLLEAVILGDGGPRHQEIVRRVLAAGANPNLADKDGVTPLAHARRKGQTAVATLIASAGGH
jgi:ankyrin repeat protein